MRAVPVFASLLAIAAPFSFGANPCGTASSNRDLTGTWNSFTAAGAVASSGPLMQSGSTVTGGYQGTAATGHPNLFLTFKNGTFDGSKFSADFSIVEQTVTASGHVDTTLSADGNTLSGPLTGTNSLGNTISGPFTIKRVSGTPTLDPPTLFLSGTAGSAPVMDKTLTLYNCGGGSLSFGASQTGAGTFLAVSPTSGSVAAGGSTALTLTATVGALKASAAPYTAEITVTGANAGPSKTMVNFTVRQPDPLAISGAVSSGLQFNASVGGDTPPPEALTVSTAGGTSVPFSVQIDGGAEGSAAPAFLSVQPLSGKTPAILTVRAAPASLAAGTYSGRIVITNPSDTTQAPTNVAATLTLASTPARLEVSPSLLHVEALSQSPAAQTFAVLLRNAGGGGPLDFSVSVAGQSPWIAVSPASGTIAPDAPISVKVTVDSQGLAAGNYLDAIKITTLGGSPSVPVSLYIAPSGPELDLNEIGVRFRGRQGQGVPNLDPVLVLNRGDAGTQVNWTAELLSGSDWLSLGTTRGTSSPGNPSNLVLKPLPAVTTFPAGTRYALVKVSDPQALNSPQFLDAVLDLSPANSPAMPDPNPGGVFFAGPAGGPPPAAQPVEVDVSSAVPVAFQASTITTDGAAWLSVTPATGTTSTAIPAIVNLSANTAILAPGVYTGLVEIVIGPVLQSVNVTLVVQPKASVNQVRDAGACAPTRVTATSTELVNNFSVPASYPADLLIELHDDCGAAILNGSVVASFSNGDPPLTLRGDTFGVYSATWQPGFASAQTTVTIHATAGTLLPVTTQLTGGVNENANRAPVLVKSGTLNNLNAVVGAAIAPGTVVQVYGTGLASATMSASTVPLPNTLNGTELIIGGQDAPIYFLSSGQLVVQVPSELVANREYSIIAVVNGALSLPDTLSLTPVQPGVAVFPDGSIIAQHADFSLVDDTHPGHPNEALVMYLVGMGGTTVGVKSGTPAPSTPLAADSVQPTVTVDGQASEIFYAGLTPGGVGLYQINFRVPPSAKTGRLDVVVKQGAVAANTVKLPVAP